MSVEFPHVRTVAASVLGEPDAIINRNIPMGNVDPPAIVEIEVTQSRLVEDPRGSLQGVGAALEPQSDRIPQDDAVSEKFDDMSYARVGLILAR